MSSFTKSSTTSLTIARMSLLLRFSSILFICCLYRSSAVRTAVFSGIKHLLNNNLSHATLKGYSSVPLFSSFLVFSFCFSPFLPHLYSCSLFLPVLLPHLGKLMDDNAEQVRSAALDLLLVIKSIASIRFFDVAPVEIILG